MLIFLRHCQINISIEKELVLNELVHLAESRGPNKIENHMNKKMTKRRDKYKTIRPKKKC